MRKHEGKVFETCIVCTCGQVFEYGPMTNPFDRLDAHITFATALEKSIDGDHPDMIGDSDD